MSSKLKVTSASWMATSKIYWARFCFSSELLASDDGLAQLTTIWHCPSGTLFVKNNGTPWQDLFHEKRYSFVDIESPDYVMVAKGYRIEGSSISKREDLIKSLETMLNYPGAYLLEVFVGKENNVFPMVPQGCSVSEIRLK